MDTVHRIYDKDRSFFVKYIKNQKYMWKFVIITLLLIDAIYFYNMFPKDALRIAKYFRPSKFKIFFNFFENFSVQHNKFIIILVMILLYSSELRRAFKSIL